jgi:hypothetical protein
VRTFDPGAVHAACEVSSPRPERDRRLWPSFASQLARVATDRRDAPSDGFLDRPPSPAAAPRFAAQLPRADGVVPDAGRDYSDRVLAQEPKLRSRVPVSCFAAQYTRGYEPPPNARLAFLDAVVAEQRVMLARLRRPPAPGVERKSLPEPLAVQAPRGDPFGFGRPYAESRYRGDALRSLKKTWPRVAAAKINPLSKAERAFDGAAFWAAHKGF